MTAQTVAQTVSTAPEAPAGPHIPGAHAGTDVSAGLPITVLDAVALSSLHALDPDGRSGVVNKVLGVYASSLQRLMAEFDIACQAMHLPGLRHVSHTLRTSSASVGALAFSAACGRVETLVRERMAGQPEEPGMADALATMQREGQAALVAVQQLVTERTGNT